MPVRVLVALLVAPLVLLAPTALAAPGCGAVTEAGAVGAASAYLLPSGSSVEVWTEWNQVPGLQRVSCANASGQTVPPDSHWVAVGPGTAFEVVRAVEDATGCQVGVPVRCF